MRFTISAAFLKPCTFQNSSRLPFGAKKITVAACVLAIFLLCLPTVSAQRSGNKRSLEIDQQGEKIIDRLERLEQETLDLRTELGALKERISLALGPDDEGKIFRIPKGESLVRGNPEAAVTLLEFGDFQSDYTTRALHVVRRLLEEYPESLQVVFKHFPVTALHPQAGEAALAALAAEKQAKGWEMHDLLLQNSRRLDPTLYLLLAQQLNLDMTQFEKDRRSLWALERLSEDEKAAVGAAVNGVPTFFLNGRRLKYWRYDYIKSRIDKVLAETAANEKKARRR